MASLGKLSLTTAEGRSELIVDGINSFAVSSHAHGQLASKLGIPKAYYDTMLEKQPELLSANVNTWLMAEASDKLLLRTLDTETPALRAVLSNKYRPLDNYDLFEAVAPVLSTDPSMRLESCNVSDTKFYLKLVTERIRAEVKQGDVVQAGIVVSNSEVGNGSLLVQPLVYRLVCSNGLISQDSSMRKHHVGKGVNGFDQGATEFFRDETRLADDRAFWLKVRDTVAHAFNEQAFQRTVDAMRESTQREITKDPFEVVEVLSERYNLREVEGKGVIAQLLAGGDLTQYGLVNAITRHSQDIADYDRATEFERLGGTVLELPRTEWNRLAVAH